MSILDRLFKKKTEEPRNKAETTNPECLKLIELSSFIQDTLAAKKYIARSDYATTLESYTSTINIFKTLESNDILGAFCKKNSLDSSIAKRALDSFDKMQDLVSKHNDSFISNALISEKEYLDNILKSVDPVINLDSEQRKVVLSDEDYTLVIAGAGAGKTTTVAAKVKYLVEKQNIDPEKILVISFTNKAVQELRDKINTGLGINCPIATFHSTGNAILHKRSDEKLNIVQESKLYFVIQDYLKNCVLTNESLANNLILFFASYFDKPVEGDIGTFLNSIAKANYSTMRSEIEDFKRQVIDARTKKSTTILNEILRSHQEVEIANLLYLNGIDYDYEPIYRYDILYARKPYTPDFIIKQGEKVAYIEHFGITESGKSNRFSNDELNSYKKAIHDKIDLHKKHGTDLIFTFSEYNDRRSLTAHLKEKLENHGFVLNPRSNKEVMKKIVSTEENRYIRRFVGLVCRFIENFKANGYTSEKFNEMYHSTINERSKLFLNICSECYLEYERFLRENNSIDFADMINESARSLREAKNLGNKLDFRYVIVDEYQDISRQRYDLVSAIHEVTSAKIIAVGDDWQSIYAFSGSDITLFTEFEKKFGYANMLKIVNTYRNSQELIDIAGGFIQKNPSQITKDLKSPKSIKTPVIIYTYDGKYKKQGENNKSGRDFALASAVERALGQIIAYNKAAKKDLNSSILLLGRFGFDGDHLERSGLFETGRDKNSIRSIKYPKLNITFMTAHASKGLGYDDVIIINGKNETYGFPSKIDDDPVLEFVINGDRSIDFAEERRLFYVAMTRTKNRVYMIAPKQNPSEFMLEVKKTYKNVELRGEWDENYVRAADNSKKCPICGYPLQFKYKNSYGLSLHICTNEPEVCGFMTNKYEAGKLAIMKCSKCRDGYMIVKSNKNGDVFLGCTNYSTNKKGCDNIIPKIDYYQMMGYKLEPAPNSGDSLAVQKPYERNSSRYTVRIKKPNLSPVYYGSFELNGVVFTILKCLNNISKTQYYGKSLHIDVLRGADSERIEKANLKSIPEYGKLRDLSREDITAIMDWLIEKGFILLTKSYYPVLHPTAKGNNYHETMDDLTLNELSKYLAQ